MTVRTTTYALLVILLGSGCADRMLVSVQGGASEDLVALAETIPSALALVHRIGGEEHHVAVACHQDGLFARGPNDELQTHSGPLVGVASSLFEECVTPVPFSVELWTVDGVADCRGVGEVALESVPLGDRLAIRNGEATDLNVTCFNEGLQANGPLPVSFDPEQRLTIELGSEDREDVR